LGSVALKLIPGLHPVADGRHREWSLNVHDAILVTTNRTGFTIGNDLVRIRAPESREPR
jgi:hypothetical protein